MIGIKTDDRLHYPGDRTDFDTRQVVGPDMFGGRWSPCGAEYDELLNQTTIYFRVWYPGVTYES